MGNSIFLRRVWSLKAYINTFIYLLDLHSSFYTNMTTWAGLEEQDLWINNLSFISLGSDVQNMFPPAALTESLLSTLRWVVITLCNSVVYKLYNSYTSPYIHSTFIYMFLSQILFFLNDISRIRLEGFILRKFNLIICNSIYI